jgi:hypothetical protein
VELNVPNSANAPRKPSIEEEEDLFAFDELIIAAPAAQPASPATAASAAPAPAASKTEDPHAEQAMAAVLGPAPQPAPAAPKAQPVANASAAPKPRAVANAHLVQIVAAASEAAKPAAIAKEARAGEAKPTQSIAPERAQADLAPPQISPLMIAVLGAVGAVNLLIVGLVWSSMSAIRTSFDELHTRAAMQVDALRAPAQSSAPVHKATIASALDRRPEGEETLERARRAIERGDFEGARRTLYELLSIVDRWPDELRDDLEARASFMLGDTYRLAADALAAKPSSSASAETFAAQAASSAEASK